MDNGEEEDSNPDIKEKIPVSGKKHGILTWKLQKDQKKKKKEESQENEDISLQKLELEAKKLYQKYNQYTQRKEQEISKLSATNYEIQPRIVTGPLKVRRVEVMPRDPGNHELKWNDISLDSDCEDNNPWSAVNSMNRDSNNNRPAVNSMNSIRPAILSTKCDHKNKISRSAVSYSKSSNKNTERAMTLQDIDCDDSIPRPAVALENCDSDQNISGTAVKSGNCDSDKNASRPADASVNNCGSDQTIPRPAAASMNLTKNLRKTEKHRKRRKTKEIRKTRPARLTRTKSNKRYEEYFLDDTDSEDREDDIDEETFSLKTELALPSTKHFNRWQKQKVESKNSSETKDEQPETDLAKWVFDVLSISKAITHQAICEQMSTTTSPPHPLEEPEEELSEDEDIPVITPEQEDVFNEYSRVDPDSTSKPFTGSAEQIPVSNIVQTLPNMVPRDGPDNKPIKHLHYISNEPITDDEDETENDGIMGNITTRLIGRAMRSSSKKIEVKPFRRGEFAKRELKEDDFRDEAPYRWAEDLISEYDTMIAAMRR